MATVRRTGKAAALAALREALHAVPAWEDADTVSVHITLGLPRTARRQEEYLLLVDDLHAVLMRLRVAGYLPDVTLTVHLVAAPAGENMT